MTPDTDTSIAPAYNASDKQKGASKTSRIPIKIIPIGDVERLKKPDWIRVKAASASTRFYEIKDILRANNLVTVCEEASCPNIGECFGKGTATFMIMGDKCTRRCPFCDVGHGRPDPLDADEPTNLAKTIEAMDGVQSAVVHLAIPAKQVFADEHQMGTTGPRMFIPPFADPVDATVNPLIWREVNIVGSNMAFRLEQQNKAGLIYGYSFDAYWLGGTRNTGWWKNITGLLLETASARIATPVLVCAGRYDGMLGVVSAIECLPGGGVRLVCNSSSGADLLRQNGLYARFWARQSGGFLDSMRETIFGQGSSRGSVPNVRPPSVTPW